MNRKWIALLVTVPLLAVACSRPQDPLQRLARELDRYPEYSVVLQDMDKSGNFFTSYYHLYKFVYGVPDVMVTTASEANLPGAETSGLTFHSEIRDWVEVDKKFFEKYEPSLGMVILSKGGDGQIDQAQYPPGYQYVGNPRYGTWRTNNNGQSFWEFYGKYALFSTLLGNLHRPTYRTDYDEFRSFRQRNAPYYGPVTTGGNRTYGTHGSYTRTTNPTFYERQQARSQARSQKFSDKARNRVGRSQGSGSRSRSGGWFGGK